MQQQQRKCSQRATTSATKQKNNSHRTLCVNPVGSARRSRRVLFSAFSSLWISNHLPTDANQLANETRKSPHKLLEYFALAHATQRPIVKFCPISNNSNARSRLRNYVFSVIQPNNEYPNRSSIALIFKPKRKTILQTHCWK